MASSLIQTLISDFDKMPGVSPFAASRCLDDRLTSSGRIQPLCTGCTNVAAAHADLGRTADGYPDQPF